MRKIMSGWKGRGVKRKGKETTQKLDYFCGILRGEWKSATKSGNFYGYFVLFTSGSNEFQWATGDEQREELRFIKNAWPYFETFN